MRNNKNHSPEVNLNLNVRGLPQSATLAINEESSNLQVNGRRIFKLGLGQSPSIAKYYPEGTIISGGLSKWCGAGGWRLGTFTFPPSLRWLLDEMAAVASETFKATSAPIQYAAVRAFQGGLKIENYLWNSRWILEKLSNKIISKLRDAGLIIAQPDGAFYLFPDFSHFKEVLESEGVKTSKALCEKILKDTGVAMLPGSAFGRPPEELTARLAYVDFDGTSAIAAVEQLKSQKEMNGEFLDTYCGSTLKAIDLICDWLRNKK